MAFDIAEMRKFSGLSDADAALLMEMKPAMEKHADTMVASFYSHLDEYPHLSNLLDAKEGRRAALQAHLKAWLLSLSTGQYGDAYQEKRYRIGQRHVEVGLDPRWVIGAMSYCRGLAGDIVEAEYSDASDKTSRAMALDRVMDLDLNIMLQSYDDKRMDMFLETTGFSKALFESMINSAT